jgi:hypothetical protein
MSSAELKLKLFREIDTLDKSKLERVYGLFVNFINYPLRHCDVVLLILHLKI